jgi:hypothetical protein
MRPLRAVIGPGSLFGAAFGWIVWSSAFVTLYGLLSIGCVYGWNDARFGPVNLLSAMLALLWLAHLALLLWLAIDAFRTRPGEGEDRSGARSLLGFASRVGYVAAFVGTLWLGFPILLLQPCA